MKKFFKILLKILKWTGIVLLSIIIILLIVRIIGRKIYNKTPEGGINEEMYIKVNGQEQWINIFGKDRENPVMLYLHGGPGMATSFGDWVVLRKLAGDYTIVNWDQRNCGKTWIHDPQSIALTPDILRGDLLAVTEYILEYTGKEKLTLLGNSWGTIYGCDFALEHPEYVECIINTSQVVDELESQKEFFLEWSGNDPEYHALAEKFDPNFNMTEENDEIFFKLAEKYTKDGHIPDEGYSSGDVSLVKAVFFDPYYSLSDLLRTLKFYSADNGMDIYMELIYHGGLYQSFSIKDKTEYKMPIYIIEGNKDYQAVYTVAEEYYQCISAPDKEFRYIDGGHMSTMLHSKELAEFVHEIREKQK